MSTVDKSLASIIPYGHILDDGAVYLRGRGWMIGFEFHGLPWESSSEAQLTAASERMTEAMRHLGTGDMVQAIYHRLPSTHYPKRDFPSEAARLIDEERRQQFESEHYWQTRSRLYVTTEIESVARSGLRSAVFGTDGWRPHIDLVLQRFQERIQKFQDALGGKIKRKEITLERWELGTINTQRVGQI
jgi:type IV secretion system protein TrbE